MKAAVLHGREDVRIEEVPLRPLSEGEVRLKIEAALTCGTDLKVYRRGYHARMIVPPAVFGHEMSGTVAEVDARVSDWKVGDRVVVANSAPCGHCFFCERRQENLCDNLLFLNGAYAQSIVIPARLVLRNMVLLRPETSFASAALSEPLACVVQGVRDARLGHGQRVLVIGAGPIGLMFVALAKARGCQVEVAGRGAERLAVAHRLGADAVHDVAEGILEPAEGDRGYDVVIEAVGKPETWQAAVSLVRKGGLVNLFGGCPAGTQVTFDTTRLHYSSITLVASFHHTPVTFREALRHIEEGTISANDFINGESRLSDLPELFRGMAEGNRAVKTLIHVS